MSVIVRRRGQNDINILMYELTDPQVQAPHLRSLIESGLDPNLRDGRAGTPLEFLAANTPTVRYPFNDEQLAPIYDEFFASPDLDFVNPTDRGYDSLFELRQSQGTHPDLVHRVEAYIYDHTGQIPPNLFQAALSGVRVQREPQGPQYDAQFAASSEEFFDLHPELGKATKSRKKAFTQALTGALWNQVMEPQARAEFVGILLDRGADPNSGKPLSTPGHSAASLHSAMRLVAVRDLTWEAVVIGKLLESGADPNLDDSTDRTPLETVITVAATAGIPRGIPEEYLAPIYDVFFASPVLDLTTTDRKGLSAWTRLSILAQDHPLLAARLEQLPH